MTQRPCQVVLLGATATCYPTPVTITTSILYPSGTPHLGHALELVQADALARYQRGLGKPVYFQTGLDEHGLKIARKAAEAGQSPREYVDAQAPQFTRLVEALNVQADRFIRTSVDGDHAAMVEAFWNACMASGDLEQRTYAAWYNVKQEEFLGMVADAPDPAVFGVPAGHIEKIEETNWFFKASRYQTQVVHALESGELKVYPDHRAKELLQFVREKGLQDVSVSRSRERLSWGLPVPGDDGQVLYVWFDALINYLSGTATVVDGHIVLGGHWPVDLHLVGKDIARFHGLLWPAMLLSAGLPLPKALMVHGHIRSGGVAMSKSLGTGVDPLVFADRYGSDAVRWFLVSAIPTLEDGDFTPERFHEVYTSECANGLGNLAHRVVSMTKRYVGEVVPQPPSSGHAERAVSLEHIAGYTAALEAHQLDRTAGHVMSLVRFANQRIDEHQPWAMAKDESRAEELHGFLYELLEMVRLVGVMAAPFVPSYGARVAEAFPGVLGEDHQGSDALRWGVLEAGMSLGEVGVTFGRVEHAD